MKIHFYLRFHTKPGQTLAITGNSPILGNGEHGKAYPMSFHNNEFWHAELEFDPARQAKLQYKYILNNEDGFRVLEWGDDRWLDITKSGIEEIQVMDMWNHAGEYENVFYTDPFREILLKDNETKTKTKTVKDFTHIFKIKAPLLKKNELPCIVGSAQHLGEWNTSSPALLSKEDGWWSLKISLPKEAFPLYYKYGVYNTREKRFIRFEGGENRVLFGDARTRKITVMHDGFIVLPNNTWKGAGISVPVFSLRTKNSFGIGEFNDLKLLADWCVKLGLKLIQVLPVNDTTATHSWLDTYPYAAISAFALHPIYLNLDELAGKEFAGLIKPLRKKQKQLNELPDLDYDEVLKLKEATSREIFELKKEDLVKDEDYQDFFKKNKHWLVPYAAFCYLRDRNGTSDFNRWKVYSKYDRDAIEKYVSPKARHYNEILYHYFIQYHLHLQLKAAAEYAHKSGVILKGDIPIGVYRYGCDAWMEPELYHLEMQAGAPPDSFAVKGQNWGFPTYNWEKMEKDGYAWWKSRFRQMSEYYGAFRIDHILGFFRIWSIPIEAVEGIMGHFVPAIPVYLNEFTEKNIWFNKDRYCKPFITDAVLWELFGPNMEKFKPFLDPGKDGVYELKKEFATQRQVQAHFAAAELTEDQFHIRQGLYDLISNVILFENPHSAGTEFHFRFGMQNTISFRYLEYNTGQQLKELYNNYFFIRQDNVWMKEAMKKLPALKRSTNMLVCGEDLGLVPHTVPDVMKQLGILSLEIQRMPKDHTREFFHPADAPYLSVVTPSSHDTSTIRGWWEEDRAKTQRFFNQELGQWSEAPWFCEPWIVKAILMQHFYSPAMWCILQFQDIMGISESLRRENPADERINIPEVSQHYWKYRMHLSLEQLIKEKSFNQQVREYVEASGRG
jgi:4-alpha-glucanotransferase